MNSDTRFAPADRATTGLLAVVTLVLGLRLAAGVSVGGAFLAHGAGLVAYTMLALLLTRWQRSENAEVVRGFAVVVVMFSLYGSLGQVAFAAIPWLGDPTLARLDEVLLPGTPPVLWLQQYATPGRVEFMSLIYALFIPYVYVSILLGLIGRPDNERTRFVTGFAILYALSLTGYLFVPARGPVVFQAAEFARPLTGGFFHNLVLSSIDAMGGPHGAFPSLHVGASTFLCLFDFRHGNTLRGMIYLPIVVLIALATLMLRYHYAVDLLAGLALALTALRLSSRLPNREHPTESVS